MTDESEEWSTRWEGSFFSLSHPTGWSITEKFCTKVSTERWDEEFYKGVVMPLETGWKLSACGHLCSLLISFHSNKVRDAPSFGHGLYATATMHTHNEEREFRWKWDEKIINPVASGRVNGCNGGNTRRWRWRLGDHLLSEEVKDHREMSEGGEKRVSERDVLRRKEVRRRRRSVLLEEGWSWKKCFEGHTNGKRRVVTVVLLVVSSRSR